MAALGGMTTRRNRKRLPDLPPIHTQRGRPQTCRGTSERNRIINESNPPIRNGDQCEDGTLNVMYESPSTKVRALQHMMGAMRGEAAERPTEAEPVAAKKGDTKSEITKGQGQTRP